MSGRLIQARHVPRAASCPPCEHIAMVSRPSRLGTPFLTGWRDAARSVVRGLAMLGAAFVLCAVAWGVMVAIALAGAA